jgi:hypothetical protein
LTEDQRKKLNGLLAFDVDSEFKYVPLAWREKDAEGNYLFAKELWPVFNLKGMDAFELAQVEDNSGEFIHAASEFKFRGRSGEKRITTLKNGVKGWKNFRNEKMEIVEYKDETSIGCLPINLQIELQNAINERKTLTEEELRGLP